MTGDITDGVSVVSRLGGGAASIGRANSARRGEGGRLIIGGALPDLWSVIAERSVRTCRDAIVSGLGPERLDLDVWLIPPSPRLRREELLHREHRTAREHVVDRPRDLVGEDRQ